MTVDTKTRQIRHILMVARSEDRIGKWHELAKGMSKLDVKCTIVVHQNTSRHPFRKVKRQIGCLLSGSPPPPVKSLLKKTKPDIIITDDLLFFGHSAVKSGIFTVLCPAGDFWGEVESYKTDDVSFVRKIYASITERRVNKTMKRADVIMPVSRYLEDIIRKRFDRPTHVLRRVLDGNVWNIGKNKNEKRLKHPCVGLVQGATIWHKTREMFVLDQILQQMPDVTFYWAGDGPYTQRILDTLDKYDNFEWLGALKPDDIRSFLSEIDVYVLLTGLDAWPVSVNEALLMQKPVVATRIGGVPEIISDGKTGLLVEAGNVSEYINAISYMLKNPHEAEQMAECGRQTVLYETYEKRVAKDCLSFLTRIWNGSKS